MEVMTNFAPRIVIRADSGASAGLLELAKKAVKFKPMADADHRLE